MLEYDPAASEGIMNRLPQSTRPSDAIITAAYEKAIEAVEGNGEDPDDGEEVLLEVKDRIARIEQQRQEIVKNASNIEHIIKDMFVNAMIQLHDIT
jgi:hypothetical protein